ncbi:MAG: hypothetical protein ACJ72A_18730 [Nocardioidaceae bacterium]
MVVGVPHATSAGVAGAGVIDIHFPHSQRRHGADVLRQLRQLGREAHLARGHGDAGVLAHARRLGAG